MSVAILEEIDRHIRQLPPEKLVVVNDFVSFLLERESPPAQPAQPASDEDARATMFASEAVLRRDWDRPEEDAAWAHL